MFKNRKKNLLLILVLVAVVIGVGTAFTAANTFDAKAGEALGYGTQTVSGANVTSMHYALSADGTHVTSVTFIADGDLTQGQPVEVGYVGFTYGSGTVGANATCAAGTYDSIANATTFVCDTTGLLSAETTVHDISSTNIAVAN